MFCSNCGRELPGETKFCQECGAVQDPPVSNRSIDVSMANGNGAAYTAETKRTIPNLTVWAILATGLCCMPIGGLSIYFAVKAKGLADKGKFQAAEAANRSAVIAIVIAVILGFVCSIIYVFASALE